MQEWIHGDSSLRAGGCVRGSYQACCGVLHGGLDRQVVSRGSMFSRPPCKTSVLKCCDPERLVITVLSSVGSEETVVLKKAPDGGPADEGAPAKSSRKSSNLKMWLSASPTSPNRNHSWVHSEMNSLRQGPLEFRARSSKSPVPSYSRKLTLSLYLSLSLSLSLSLFVYIYIQTRFRDQARALCADLPSQPVGMSLLKAEVAARVGMEVL